MTGIEWTDATWNPVTGCKKVSEGCKHCYAERMWKRLSAHNMPYHGRDFTDIQIHPERLKQPLRWTRSRRVFVCSMSDLFSPAVPLTFIYRVFAVMAIAQWHTFQILTKRPGIMWGVLSHPEIKQRILSQMASLGRPDITSIPWPLPNVWLGTSVEDQSVVKDRLPMLMGAPAAVRFVSVEPLLDPLDLSGYEALDWVIVGGESGKGARPMQPAWARAVRIYCQEHQIPFFFKQWGEWAPEAFLIYPKPFGDQGFMDSERMHRVGKRRAARLLDGELHDGFPGEVANGSG